MNRPMLFVALAASASLLRPAPALAAESYDSCTGFITSLPATITTQGTWCLSADLATAIAGGSAITVATNNVTIDCNRFKIGGLQAGLGTQANGILAESRLNTTVRNCNIRGFFRGIYVEGGGGHMVEGNRFDGNTYQGIFLYGAGSTIRDNQVFDTGGSTVTPSTADGIFASQGVDVIDNTVNGVAPTGSNAFPYGIFTNNNGDGSVVGNRVRGLAPNGTGVAYGIAVSGSGAMIRDNIVQGPGGATGFGVHCTNNLVAARNNMVARFATGVANCLSVSNTVIPN